MFAKRTAIHSRDWAAAALLFLGVFACGSAAAAAQFAPPQTELAGMTRSDHIDATKPLQIVVEFEPRDPSLETLADAVGDSTSPQFRRWLGKGDFDARFGRPPAEAQALAAYFRANNGKHVYISSNNLIVGADFTVQDAERALKTKYVLYAAGDRTAVAPTTPLTLPVGNIRAVRGAVSADTPRFADVATGTPTDFRGGWYPAKTLRDLYAVPDGAGAGKRITLIADASDAYRRADLFAFIQSEGGPGGAAIERVIEHRSAEKSTDQSCGRDDRGQEATLDVDALLTMAPLAQIDVDYDDVCVRGGEGTLALARALEASAPPDVIIFPFAVRGVFGTVREAFGKTSLPYLEAAVRGIPLVVPSGDDGPLGVRPVPPLRVAVAYPCVLPYVICVGGTEIGTRAGTIDEAPWNDGDHASGGGISNEPRPAWQDAPSAFEFSAAYVKNRMVPDVSADAAGHLRVYWHDYFIGGVGGTSESAAIVGAQIADINAAVPVNKRIAHPGDLYRLAKLAPAAFGDITRENDRSYSDNTIRPRRVPLPLGFAGVMPSPPPILNGCARVQPSGCAVKPGYDAVTGIGSLRVKAAIESLR